PYTLVPYTTLFRSEDDLTKVNEVLDQAPLSLTVPSYMDVDSIEDLKDNKELGEATDWKLTGIDPGAGIMNSAEKAMDEYGLDNRSEEHTSELQSRFDLV